MEILDDPDRTFATSDFVRLEVLPKSIFHRRELESAFYEVFFAEAAILSTPEIRGGRPRLSGTGVTVQRVVSWYKLGLEPEEIADRLGHLSLAQVHAALAYYHAA
jgi:uncharacterized protein (DUF433 family)